MSFTVSIGYVKFRGIVKLITCSVLHHTWDFTTAGIQGGFRPTLHKLAPEFHYT